MNKNNQNCYYQTYDQIRRKKLLIQRSKYLLNSECCDYESCDNLISDLQKTKNVCNDLFRTKYSEIDEKGNIKDSLCSDLLDKQKKIMENSLYKQTAGKYNSKSKRYNTSKRHYKRYNKSKRHYKRYNKSKRYTIKK